MSNTIDHRRRRFLGMTAVSFAAAGLGAVPSAKSASASFGPLKQINAGVLTVGYAETGPLDGSSSHFSFLRIFSAALPPTDVWTEVV